MHIMNYSLLPIIDIKQTYKYLADEFAKQYYTLYDNNFLQLANLYLPDSYFTYLDEEITGFNNLVQRLRQYGITKFTHSQLHLNVQPIGERSLMISVTGLISVNNGVASQRFSETVLLQKDDYNHFFIYRTIFKLLN